MDRVTKSYLMEFKKQNGFYEINDDTLAFEHFVNYTLSEPRIDYNFDIEELNIGKNGTVGLDGFAIILNRNFITSTEELDDFLNENKKATCEVIFIQSKTSKGFDTKEIGGFGFAVNDFINEEQKLAWSDVAKEKISMFSKLVERFSELNEKPKCSIYYVTLGRDEKDINVLAILDKIKKEIYDENIFLDVDVNIIDQNELHKRYKKTNQVIEKKIEFPRRITLPIMEGIQESYIGTVNAKTIIDLMVDDEGELLANIFYDNVRDYQGENTVNKEIAKTLQSDYKDSFLILNNGITIVAESLKTTRDTFHISNYQIINGCQTSHVIYENRELLNDLVEVPVKLIITNDENITSRIIRSTNRQTEVTEQDLIAFSDFQKKLEDFYTTYTGEEALFYERRSKQYSSKAVDRKRIIDKTTQIKTVASLFEDKPNVATRFFGTLFNEFSDKLFKDNHKLIPYYTASFTYYKLDLLFRNGKLDKKFRKIKYHLLTLIKYEIHESKGPTFESSKIEKYCEEILNIVKNEGKFIEKINEVVKKIESLDFDLEKSDISKSTEFVKKCIELYKNKQIN